MKNKTISTVCDSSPVIYAGRLKQNGCVVKKGCRVLKGNFRISVKNDNK